MAEYIITDEQLDKLANKHERIIVLRSDCGDAFPVSIEGEILRGLVRCKDCRFYEYDAEGWDEVLMEQYGEPPCICMYPDGNGDYRRMYAEPHDFCSWGERFAANGGDGEAVE